MAKPAEADESLKRLGGGRWQTRDERFTIEPQSGTWVVVDGEQTDDLGLALVRGPFGSLGAAKEAIAAARGSEPEASPLAARVKELGARPAAKAAKPAKGARSAGAAASAERAEGAPTATRSKPKPEPEAEPEPRWMAALEPADRRRATRLIDRLAEAGAPDPEGIARRDIVGDVPAVAEFAIARALLALGGDATAAKVASLLAGGRDEDLGVRWRLVDDDDRPITIDVDVAKRRRS